MEEFVIEWAWWLASGSLTVAIAYFTRLDLRIWKLLDMHRHPDEYGFGTGETNENAKESLGVLKEIHVDLKESFASMIEHQNELIRHQRSTTHYQAWLGEQITGKKAPPPPGDATS